MNKAMIKSCSQSILSAAMLIAMGLATAVQAASISPLGTWDMVLSGHRQGTAYFTFNPDNTFTVTEVIVPNAVSTNSSSVGRGGETIGRNGSSSGGTTFVPGPQVFGGQLTTNGFWGLDAQGRTIGFFIEVSPAVNCTTTPIPISTTNLPTVFSPPDAPPVTQTNNPTTDPTFCVTDVILGSTNMGSGVTNYAVADICYTNVVICNNITNQISFVGTVSTKRINLECTTPFGNTSYRGVPATAIVPPISGLYFGMKQQNGVSYLEFLTLSIDGNFPPNENIYDVALTGPGYTYNGVAILSSQKRISFDLGQTPAIPTNAPSVVRAVTGPFNPKKDSANMLGWDTDGTGTFIPSEQIRFNIQPEP